MKRQISGIFLGLCSCLLAAIVASAGENISTEDITKESMVIKLTIDDAITAGELSFLKVTIVDQKDQVLTGYTGTIQLVTSDTSVNSVFKKTYTFTREDKGMHVFPIKWQMLRVGIDLEKYINYKETQGQISKLEKQLVEIEKLVDSGEASEQDLSALEDQISTLRPQATLHSITVKDIHSGQSTTSDILVFPASRMSLILKDTDIREAILQLVSAAGINVAMDETVQGLFSITCQSMYILDLFKAVLQSRKLTFERQKELLWVYPVPAKKMETRDFVLPYVISTRTGRGEITATSGSGQVRSGTSTVNTSTTSDFWTVIATNLSKLLSPEGNFVINPLVSLIRVTDYPERVTDVAQFLKKVEKASLRQVAIRAEIMEIKLDGNQSMGIDWANVVQRGESQLFMGLNRKALKAFGNIDSPLALPEYDSNNFKIGIFERDKFSAVIEMLRGNGNMKILSAPTVTTLNNQTAIIKTSVEDVAWEKTVEKDDQGNPVEVSYTSEDISRGIILDVTPYIDDQDRITLSIHPSISEKIGESSPPGDNTSSRPVLSIREMNSVVQLEKGQTLVLGGLIKERQTVFETGVPFLMDLPFIGFLFKRQETETESIELVITVTPYIIDNDIHDKTKMVMDLRTEKIKEGVSQIESPEAYKDWYKNLNLDDPKTINLHSETKHSPFGVDQTAPGAYESIK
ncbi:MAG: hypothetical protein HQK77_03550 [Desulfobacterales bacterium]|nr:hypothetical protein [Desulfobacterales bacterium]